MNKHLSEAVARISEFPDERQEEAAVLLQHFLQVGVENIELTPEQLAELDKALSEDEYVTEEQAETFFAQLKK